MILLPYWIKLLFTAHFCRLQYRLTPSSKESSWNEEETPTIKTTAPLMTMLHVLIRFVFLYKYVNFILNTGESAPINRVTFIHDLGDLGTQASAS